MLDAPAQNQDGSRQLNCLIEGESNVFVVTVGSGNVSQLMKEIKRERELSTLKDIDPTTLELCKVSAMDESLRKVALAYSRSLTGRY